MAGIGYKDLATFGQRLWFITSEKGLKDTLIQELEISDKTLDRYFKDITSPTASGIAKISDLTGKSADWLLRGIEPPSLSARADTDVISIPRWDVEVAAGAGRVSEAPNEIERVPFAKSLLASLDVDADYAHLVTVRGDSMLETLADGDNVLVDTKSPKVRRDGIYVVAANGLAMIKRVQIIASMGAVRLISDNARYEPITARLDGNEFTLIGEAKLVMRVL